MAREPWGLGGGAECRRFFWSHNGDLGVIRIRVNLLQLRQPKDSKKSIRSYPSAARCASERSHIPGPTRRSQTEQPLEGHLPFQCGWRRGPPHRCPSPARLNQLYLWNLDQKESIARLGAQRQPKSRSIQLMRRLPFKCCEHISGVIKVEVASADNFR